MHGSAVRRQFREARYLSENFGQACSDTSLHPPVSVQQPILHGDVNWLMLGAQSFSILTAGPHEVKIMDMQGREMESMQGLGRQIYGVSNLAHNAVYYLEVKTPLGTAFKAFFHN